MKKSDTKLINQISNKNMENIKMISMKKTKN